MVTRGFSVVATIGTVLSMWLNLATLRTLNERRRLLDQGLGPLNPYHFIYAISSNIIWFVYGCIIDDYYVLTNRIIGLILNSYYILTCLSLMAIYWGKMNYSLANADGLPKELLNEELHRMKTVQYGVIGVVGLWLVVCAVIFAIFKWKDGRIFGYICGWHSNIYYLVRLPHVYAIFRTKSVVSIIPQYMLVDFMCCVSWFFYGLAINNSNFYIPNGVGLIFSSSYMILYCLYRNSNPPAAPHPGNANAKEIAMSPSGTALSLSESAIEMLSTDAFYNTAQSRDNTHTSLKISVVDLETGSPTHSHMSAAQPRVVSGMGATATETISGLGLENSGSTPAHRHGTYNVVMQLPEQDASKFPAPDTPRPLVEQLDTAMEYLLNIGRTRSDTLSLNPASAISVPSLENLSDIYQQIKSPHVPPSTGGALCKVCGNPLAGSDAESALCLSCGTVTTDGTRQNRSRAYSNMDSEHGGCCIVRSYSTSSLASNQSTGVGSYDRGGALSLAQGVSLGASGSSSNLAFGRDLSAGAGAGGAGGGYSMGLSPSSARSSRASLAGILSGGGGGGGSGNLESPLSTDHHRPSVIEEERQSLIAAAEADSRIDYGDTTVALARGQDQSGGPLDTDLGLNIDIDMDIDEGKKTRGEEGKRDTDKK